jgi:hypothetical protein
MAHDGFRTAAAQQRYLVTRPTSRRAARAATWITGDPAPGSYADALAGLFLTGFACFGPPTHTPPARLIGDRVLRSVPVPVGVLLAGDTVHDTHRAERRMSSVVPHWRRHVWPAAGHGLPAELPAEVNAVIRDIAR